MTREEARKRREKIQKLADDRGITLSAMRKRLRKGDPDKGYTQKLDWSVVTPDLCARFPSWFALARHLGVSRSAVSQKKQELGWPDEWLGK